MAKKDTASKRLAEEIAFAKLLKKTPPLYAPEDLFTPEELAGLAASEELPASPWVDEKTLGGFRGACQQYLCRR
jgi:hypothetical protein